FWTVVGLVCAWLLLLGLAWLFIQYQARHATPRTPKWRRSIDGFLKDFLEAGGELIRWRTALLVIPTALYLLVYVVDLYAVTRAAGVHAVSFVDATSIYAFVLLTVILIPIPTELGLTEFSGLAALLAFHVDRPTAAIIMLGLRVLATGMTILVAGVILLVLHGEFSQPEAVVAEDRRAPGTAVSPP
ncbi:MAG TPA: lysylphosphatidylglycerol synthase domain-containing protein, partial [Steroidobacteraceae bacterium]|nr:lysylphosphatidylglycerol synthase domain-containing protein [Steroidobacteraceae bacterium]